MPINKINRITKESLVALVNAKEGLSLDSASVSLSPVTLVNGTIDDFNTPNERNSSIDIIAPANGASPEINIEVLFNRLRLNRLFELRSVVFNAPLGTSRLGDYLPQISDRIGLDLMIEDIVNADVVVEEGQTTTVALVAAEQSLNVLNQISLNFTHVPVEEEDDMHYYAAPGSTSYDQESVGEEALLKAVYFTIDAGCGTPLVLMNSNPTSDEVLTITDLSTMTLTSCRVTQSGVDFTTPMMRYGMQGEVTGMTSQSNIARTFHTSRVVKNTTAVKDLVRSNASMFMVEFQNNWVNLGDGPTEVLLTLADPSVPKPIYLSLLIYPPA